MKIIRTSTIPLSLDILLKGQLKFLSQYFKVIGLSSNGDLLSKVEKREGIKAIAVNMERGISPFRDLISLIWLIKCFNREKPMIVHSITPKAGLLSMLAAKITGVPIRMHTFTGLIFPTKTGVIQRLLIKMDQLLCWAATNIYPEGQGVMDDLVRYKITAKPLKILANGNVNGVDLDYFSIDGDVLASADIIKAEIGIKAGDFVFIFVGRLVGDKGINELVKAFLKLSNESGLSNSIKLLLVGPLEFDLDPLSDGVLREIEENPNIISVGFQSDVRSYFAASDVLVFPSYREGFPNVVMQAGAMGLPSVVSNISGCNEIIVEGLNGSIIPVKDVDALAKAMGNFIVDKPYFERLRSNARSMIQERYEQQLVWKALLQEYNTLLKRKGLS